MERAAGPSGDNARGLMDFAETDGIGHPSSIGTSHESSVSLIRNESQVAVNPEHLHPNDFCCHHV